MIIFPRPSPNFRGRGEHSPTLIVLHSDASPSMEATLSWITSKESHVSYHYSVGRNGNVYQHVDDVYSAWHAGASAFNGETDGKGGVNDFSIGINISNRQDGVERFYAPQLDVAAILVADLCKKWSIPQLRICTHAFCATPPGRKHDPFPGGPFNLMDFLTRVQRATAA